MTNADDIKLAAHQAGPVLRVPSSQFDQEIDQQLKIGHQLHDLLGQYGQFSISPNSVRWVDEPWWNDLVAWEEANEQLLKSRFSTPKLADNYRKITHINGAHSVYEMIGQQIGFLDRIRRYLVVYLPLADDSPARTARSMPGTKVFVVHGHDGELKYQVAEFLEQVTGARPVIFHEQPDSGRTIIEKFEDLAADAGFAVVLLTADDEGRAKRGTAALSSRARQNVVLELGFFIGKLGRDRVAVLYAAGVELPSDLRGVLYKPVLGNWHTELARELQAAGIPVNLGGLSR